MFPSFATMAIGVAITAVLAVVDWYVWRVAPVPPNRLTVSDPRAADATNGAAFKEVA